ncbi:hypothetical protein COT60_00165 [Candidatus Pacearchaeota archaeon CG09_land_8_20_14_0_10_30_9]|nr:hypothetical protein [Candidatus Pacearchaeota archaeon]OIO40558.1 MAG: hypothetical protein AUJ61_01820 [Candidatus Pacearchaeota archaeon CG1_02_30_18]PIN71552.1 MAG: hypothetical protein COV77_01480 [Candidatus Pacearchaeota archaeon CG11_big_fil_rev_8_21_14_0_20_30_13]PIO01489.1 MAG: hypothetical protein COT60_00165 [Candidatus Pacearchaeota archaeon CG09_land_8_20_14_0_10_30_9]PIZ81750.1 MAG: hypothetical protein COX98_02725 [Candidatus Pacearchaeota archaeon CG_4_10_14_0_2_um_filter_30
MKKPYIKKRDQIGNLKIWVVNGNYIRNNLDVEFTNCGEHYVFPFIPKDELWLDEEFGTKDEKHYIDYLLTEYSLMSKGVSYDNALIKADLIQKREIQKEKGFKQLKKLKEKENYKLIEKIHKKLLKTYSDHLKVWIIDGKIVREIYFIDFVEGGHDKVYSFVPKNEIWIDDDISQKERKLILLHEAHERYLMSKGFTYRDAHASSSRIEHKYRTNKIGLDEALKKEILNNDKLIKKETEVGYLHY